VREGGKGRGGALEGRGGGRWFFFRVYTLVLRCECDGEAL
jgi:hypothetical protein